jgi:hypothetical protein
LGTKLWPIAFPHPTPPHPSSNIFKSSISRCRKSSAPGSLNLRKSDPHKNLRQTLSNPHKSLRKLMKVPHPHLNAERYLLNTSRFQSRGIHLPMTLGLGLRLTGCIQSYTGTTTKITNINTTNISTSTTTTTEKTTYPRLSLCKSRAQCAVRRGLGRGREAFPSHSS